MQKGLAVPHPEDVQRAFREELSPLRRSAVLSWLPFSITFSLVRAVTYSIRDGRGPFHDVSAGGMHLHHCSRPGAVARLFPLYYSRERVEAVTERRISLRPPGEPAGPTR